MEQVKTTLEKCVVPLTAGGAENCGNLWVYYYLYT